MHGLPFLSVAEGTHAPITHKRSVLTTEIQVFANLTAKLLHTRPQWDTLLEQTKNSWRKSLALTQKTVKLT